MSPEHQPPGTSKQMANNLAKLNPKAKTAGEFAGLGLMIGFDLRPPDPSAAKRWIHTFMLACRARGVHLTYTIASPTIRLLPPLTIDREAIDFAIQVFDRSLAELTSGSPSIEDLSPKNPFTAKVTAGSGWRGVLSRLWETSPQYWVERLHRRG